jgi:hypothetical protein
MSAFLSQQFSGASIFSVQQLLLTLAEYVTANINSTSIYSQENVLQAIQQTLFNILDILNAYQLQSLAAQEYSTLQNVNGIFQYLSAQDQILINARLISLNLLSTTIYPLPLILTANVNNLTNGQPALESYDLTSYMIQFGSGSTGGTLGEIPPTGLTVNNLISNAQDMANAWLAALNYLNTTTNRFYLTAYNPIDRMYNCSLDTFNLISNYNTDPVNLNLYPNLTATQLTQVWNSIVALPSILRVLGLLYNDPSQVQYQEINALKFTIFNLIYATNAVLSTFVIPNNLPQPITAKIQALESLMDFAARTTGNFENWTLIAAANNLQPPYTGTAPAPGIATPGTYLFLPPYSSSSPISSYSDAYLGTDIDIGLPGSTLTTWVGDFSLISGLNNYIGALARRILTPLGALIYHSSYGSQLPPEVGNIATASEAMLLANYLRIALLQDPRTQSVNSIQAFPYPAIFGAIVMNASVTPFGLSSTPFNLVLQPLSNTNLVNG